ncbi:zinc-binding protein A33-like [Narcine bancroftii]|uniref:zinc-binding protein A33-like n=1 Tax=Narcine bancroftii TaxID=1343680 RepID=UPI0038315DBC
MASKEQFKSWTEEVICPVCLDFFTDPVTLECGHNFCRSCITQSWAKAGRNSCPECREEFVDGTLRVNRAMASLAERARKVDLNPAEKERKSLCEEHQEELKLFCATDKKLICVICRDSLKHREHRFLPVQEAAHIYQDQIESSMQCLTERKSAMLEIEQRQKEKISGVQDQADNLQSHITSQFAQLHQTLMDKEQRMLNELREEEERVVNPMQENLQQIQKRLKSIQQELSMLQKRMDEKDIVIFLKKGAHRKSRIVVDENVLSVRDDALRTENFDNPFLLDRVVEEILDAMKQVSVTLDVDTAGPGLEVSEDRKSVRLSRTQRDLPDTGKRFTDLTCALGSEGFSSGRHYWEVEVSGNRGWSLGVAAESVGRKGRVPLTPKAGVWRIWRGGDRFYVNTSPRSCLPTGPVPATVGVYLSYESGTVSFYSVDTRSHLHTFTGCEFTGKLYPFFRSWNGNWLRICSGPAPDP